MLTITDGGSLSRALTTSIDPLMKQLLILRRDQLGDITDQARFIVLQPGDSLEALEKELGFPIVGDPACVFGPEWVADHGTFFEALWLLTDDGYGHVTIFGKQPGTDSRLLELCAAYADEQLTT